MELLAELAHAGASPGFEQEIREIIIREIRDHVDELRLSRLGSVVITIRADSENCRERPLKVLLLGGMSQIGFVVKQVDANGLLHLSPLGEWCPQQYIGHHVLVRTKDKVLQGVIRECPSHLHEVLVDVGIPELEVLKIVEIGNLVGLNPDYSEDPLVVNGKTLENVAAIYTLIQVIKNIRKDQLKCHFSVVFTNQEHLRTRKHMQDHFSLSPDLSISLECVKVTKQQNIGEGPIIGSGSNTELAHPLVINTIKRVADKHQIPHQLSSHPELDINLMRKQMSEFGHYLGGVSIPLEVKCPMGLSAHKKDLINTCRLLESFSYHHDFGDFEKHQEELVNHIEKEYSLKPI